MLTIHLFAPLLSHFLEICPKEARLFQRGVEYLCADCKCSVLHGKDAPLLLRYLFPLQGEMERGVSF